MNNQKQLILLEKSVQNLQQVLENKQDLLHDILVRVVLQTLDKYQQRVNVGVQDSVRDLLDHFKKKIQKEIFDAANNWLLTTHSEKFLFPQDCRFLNVREKNLVAVIENQPGPRTLNLFNLFADNVVTTPHTLCLPYTYFVFHFNLNNDKARLLNVYHAWRVNPLQKLNDAVYDPILPNIHENYCICSGNIQDFIKGTTVSEICNEFIQFYWSSTFNSDLSVFWQSGLKLSPFLKDVETWEKSTLEHPYFFSEVSLHNSGKTIESMIDFCCNSKLDDCDVIRLKHNLGDSIEKFSDSFFDSVMRFFKQTKFEKHYPKEIKDVLANAIKDITDEISEITLILDKKIDRFEKPTSYGWISKSKEWR